MLEKVPDDEIRKAIRAKKLAIKRCNDFGTILK
jgi:hypothetical protein